MNINRRKRTLFPIHRISFLSLLVLTVCFSSKAFASDFKPMKTEELLLSYIENDSELKNLIIAAEKTQLSYDSTQIDNGFDISLSSGNISISTKDGGTKISAKPSVTASLPQYQNLNLSAGADVGSDGVKNTKLSVGVDILSENAANREISLLKAERNLLESKRKIQNQAIAAESAFYNELKSLLSSTTSLIQAQLSLYSDTIDFESVKAKGYNKTSSTYVMAEMKVKSGEHKVESGKRSLVHDYVVFYKKCGYDISIDANQDFTKLVPSDIPLVQALNISDFAQDDYSTVEAAKWNYKINSMQRSAKRFVTLSANAGYTFNNTIGGSSTGYDTLDAGLSSKIGGLSLGAGINIPVAADAGPSFNLSFSVSPNAFRKTSIDSKVNDLNEKQDLLSIESAITAYETAVVDTQQKLEDILWEKNSNQETYKMYAVAEKNMAGWYKQGIISESQYLSSKVNAQLYEIKLVINAIDLIVYNNNVKKMFVDRNMEN